MGAQQNSGIGVRFFADWAFSHDMQLFPDTTWYSAGHVSEGWILDWTKK
jgi:hypothetical protein